MGVILSWRSNHYIVGVAGSGPDKYLHHRFWSITKDGCPLVCADYCISPLMRWPVILAVWRQWCLLFSDCWKMSFFFMPSSLTFWLIHSEHTAEVFLCNCNMHNFKATMYISKISSAINHMNIPYIHSSAMNIPELQEISWAQQQSWDSELELKWIIPLELLSI